MNAFSTAETAAESSPARWLKTRELAAFFVLTFLITFAGWIPVFLGLPGSDLFNVTGLWGPALAALLVTALARGKPGLKALFRRLLLWRVPGRWYLVILLGWPAVSLLAAFLHARITGQPLVFEWGRWSGTRTWLVQALLLGFWACEEIGWRGFALPRLLERWNAFTASLILGVVWALWHLPYFFFGMPYSFLIYALYLLAVSVLMTWIFNHTQGSLLVAVIFHFWFNMFDILQADKLPLAQPGGEVTAEAFLLTGAAALVVLVFGHRSLTRSGKQAVTPALKPSGGA